MAATYGYAWIIKASDEPYSHWELCRWVEPTLEALEKRSKPSPEARAVRVQIIPTRRSVRCRLRVNERLQARWRALQESMRSRKAAVSKGDAE